MGKVCRQTPALRSPEVPREGKGELGGVDSIGGGHSIVLCARHGARAGLKVPAGSEMPWREGDLLCVTPHGRIGALTVFLIPTVLKSRQDLPGEVSWAIGPAMKGSVVSAYGGRCGFWR